jgi:outer membrane protein TolC
LQAQRQYEAALFALAALMGLPDARLPAKLKLVSMKTESDEMLSPPDVNEILDYAMTHRPDLLAQKTAIDISESAVGIARGQYYPRVYFNAAYSGSRRDDYSFEGDDYGNSIGVFMTYNLFAGGRHRSRVIESKSRLQENEKKLQEVTKNAVASVRAAVTMVRSAQEQFSLQQANAELATKTRDLVKKEYMAGKASLTRLNEVQKDLIKIQGFFAQSRVALRQAWLDMEKESGRILDRFGPF